MNKVILINSRRIEKSETIAGRCHALPKSEYIFYISSTWEHCCIQCVQFVFEIYLFALDCICRGLQQNANEYILNINAIMNTKCTHFVLEQRLQITICSQQMCSNCICKAFNKYFRRGSVLLLLSPFHLLWCRRYYNSCMGTVDR